MVYLCRSFRAMLFMGDFPFRGFAPSVNIYRSVGARGAPFIEKIQPLVENILKTLQTFLPLSVKFLS